jgi:hypothetical protein
LKYNRLIFIPFSAAYAHRMNERTKVNARENIGLKPGAQAPSQEI